MNLVVLKTDRVVDFLYVVTASLVIGKYLAVGRVEFSYILCAVIFLISVLVNKKMQIPKNKYELIPLILSLSYVYGVILGFYYGNRTVDVFTNFGGLFLFFSLYYFGIYKFTLHRIVKVSTFIVLVNIVEILTYIVIANVLGEDGARELASKYMLDGLANLTGDGDSRYFITNSAWVFIFLFLFLHSLKSGETKYIRKLGVLPRNINSLLLFVLSIAIVILLSYLLLVITDSKGFQLAAFMGIIVLLLGDVYENPVRNLLFIIFVSSILFLFISMQSSDVLKPLTNIYSPDASGNEIRYEQIGIVLERLSFIGNGLGADFGSYTRTLDGTASYGIELTYLNLVDKLGVVGVLITGIYFFIFYKFSSYVLLKKDKFVGIFGLGLVAFIWPSIGNPMLLSVSYVIAFLFAIRLIAITENKRLEDMGEHSWSA